MDRSVQDHHYYKKITVRHLISFKPRKNFFVRGLSSCNDLKISEKQLLTQKYRRFLKADKDVSSDLSIHSKFPTI